MSKPGWEDNLTLAQVWGLMGTGHYASLWDAGAAMPYLERTGGGSVVCYENPESIRRKCEYARAAGCGGMMIWSLGADTCGEQAPLMDAVAQAEGGRPQRLGRSAIENEIVTLGQVLAHHGKLEHASTRPAPVDGGGPSALATLSHDQIESLHAQLSQATGVLDDQTWQDQKPAK